MQFLPISCHCDLKFVKSKMQFKPLNRAQHSNVQNIFQQLKERSYNDLDLFCNSRVATPQIQKG